MMINISVIVPVFRATSTLLQIVEGFYKYYGETIEVIFVFDCGKESSLIYLKKLVSRFKNCKAIVLNRNYGQHNAIICGIEEAKGEFIVTMDEDLQHLPEDLKQLISKQQETDADVVYGVYDEKNHSIFRNITSRLANRLLKIGIPELHPDYSAYRLIKSSVAKKMVDMRNSYTFLDGYLSWLTSDVQSVTIRHQESQAGESSYTFKKLLNHTINIFVTFSDLPIKLLSLGSFVFILFSVGYSLYIIISSLTNTNYEAGFPTFVAFLGFGFGMVLFGLGVIGEYIARINYKTTQKPNYFIKEIIQ